MSGRYYGECLGCQAHVRNGHGRAGQFTLCPPCCAKQRSCKECEGMAAEPDVKPSTADHGEPHGIIGGYGVGE